jgi:hypothetical protein
MVGLLARSSRESSSAECRAHNESSCDVLRHATLPDLLCLGYGLEAAHRGGKRARGTSIGATRGFVKPRGGNPGTGSYRAAATRLVLAVFCLYEAF